MELVSVAALDTDRVIGTGRALPWESIPADRRQYRERVADQPVIIGRRTFDSMRGDLPGRVQVVLSRTDRSYDVETAVHADDVETAVDHAVAHGDVAYVLGGAAIYEAFQPHLDRMVLSHVEGSHDGDAYYPAWDEDEWVVTSETEYDRFTLREYDRA